MGLLALAAALILSGCAVSTGQAGGDSPPTWPTPLPSAVPPERPPDIWALSYQHTFPPQFWSPGRHNYRFRIDCPELGLVESVGIWRSFSVFEDAPGNARPTIYLRQIGLSTRPLGDANRYYIHPDQPTVASVTFLGLSQEQAEALAASPECRSAIMWDDGVGVRELSVGEPYWP